MAEAMVVRYRQKYMQDNLVNPPVDVFLLSRLDF